MYGAMIIRMVLQRPVNVVWRTNGIAWWAYIAMSDNASIDTLFHSQL